MKSAAKFTFLLLSLIFITSTSFAERVWTPENGVQVLQGSNITFNNYSAQDDNGNVMIVWVDARNGDFDIWGQLFDANGVEQWDENGLLLVSENLAQNEPWVTASEDGNWIISWMDFRNDEVEYYNNDIYAQKINSSGQKLWLPENGVRICDEDGRQDWMTHVTDGNGGALFLWADQRNDSWDMFAQHIDSNGNVLWNSEGIMAAGGPGGQG
jgi:hypothetical protein